MLASGGLRADWIHAQERHAPGGVNCQDGGTGKALWVQAGTCHVAGKASPRGRSGCECGGKAEGRAREKWLSVSESPPAPPGSPCADPGMGHAQGHRKSWKSMYHPAPGQPYLEIHQRRYYKQTKREAAARLGSEASGSTSPCAPVQPRGFPSGCQVLLLVPFLGAQWAFWLPQGVGPWNASK